MLADWCSHRSAACPPGIAEEDFEELEGTHLRTDARLGLAGGNRHGTVRLRPGRTALRYEPLCTPQRQQGDGRGAADGERSASYHRRAHIKAAQIKMVEEPTATAINIRADYVAKNGAPSAAAPKIFFRYYYVNSSTGEKSGVMLAETTWTAGT